MSSQWSKTSAPAISAVATVTQPGIATGPYVRIRLTRVVFSISSSGTASGLANVDVWVKDGSTQVFNAIIDANSTSQVGGQLVVDFGEGLLMSVGNSCTVEFANAATGFYQRVFAMGDYGYTP